MNKEKDMRSTTESQVNIDQGSKWLTAENIIGNLPFLLMLALLALIYIANSHYHIKLEREMQQTQRDMKVLRWEYMTSKSDLMYKSKQSEVAKIAAPHGLKPLTEPPKKLIVRKGEY